MRKTKWLAAAGVAGVLALTSCGGSSGEPSASEAAYIEGLSKSIAAENTFGGGPESADCLATGLVKAIGVKALAASNILPDDFAGGAAINLSGIGQSSVDKVVDFLASGKCVNLAEQLAESMRAGSGGTMTEAQAQCVADKFVKQDAFRRGLRASLTGNADSANQADRDALQAVMVECGAVAGS